MKTIKTNCTLNILASIGAFAALCQAAAPPAPVQPWAFDWAAWQVPANPPAVESSPAINWEDYLARSISLTGKTFRLKVDSSEGVILEKKAGVNLWHSLVFSGDAALKFFTELRNKRGSAEIIVFGDPNLKGVARDGAVYCLGTTRSNAGAFSYDLAAIKSLKTADPGNPSPPEKYPAPVSEKVYTAAEIQQQRKSLEGKVVKTKIRAGTSIRPVEKEGGLVQVSADFFASGPQALAFFQKLSKAGRDEKLVYLYIAPEGHVFCPGQFVRVGIRNEATYSF